jgi:hypothetical protein
LLRAAGRHLEAVAAFEDVEEEALVRLAGKESGAAGAALEQAVAVADVELGECLGGAVAALAIADKDGLNRLQEEFVAGLGGERERGTEKYEEAKHGSTPVLLTVSAQKRITNRGGWLWWG